MRANRAQRGGGGEGGQGLTRTAAAGVGVSRGTGSREQSWPQAVTAKAPEGRGGVGARVKGGTERVSKRERERGGETRRERR